MQNLIKEIFPVSGVGDERGTGVGVVEKGGGAGAERQRSGWREREGREKIETDLLIQTTRHKGKMSVGFKKFKPLSADFNTR